MGAERRVNYVKRLLDEIGLGGERIEMFFLSSSEGARFAEICKEMTDRIGRLGPNPLGPSAESCVPDVKEDVENDSCRTEVAG